MYTFTVISPSPAPSISLPSLTPFSYPQVITPSSLPPSSMFACLPTFSTCILSPPLCAFPIILHSVNVSPFLTVFIWVLRISCVVWPFMNFHNYYMNISRCSNKKQWVMMTLTNGNQSVRYWQFSVLNFFLIFVWQYHKNGVYKIIA